MFMIPDLSVDWEDPQDSGVSLLIDDAGGDVEVRRLLMDDAGGDVEVRRLLIDDAGGGMKVRLLFL